MINGVFLQIFKKENMFFNLAKEVWLLLLAKASIRHDYFKEHQKIGTSSDDDDDGSFFLTGRRTESETSLKQTVILSRRTHELLVNRSLDCRVRVCDFVVLKGAFGFTEITRRKHTY